MENWNKTQFGNHPTALETGEWDGKRSDWVLVVDETGLPRVGRVYSGRMDGSEFNDYYDTHDYELKGVTHWRKIYLP